MYKCAILLILNFKKKLSNLTFKDLVNRSSKPLKLNKHTLDIKTRKKIESCGLKMYE